MEEAKFNFFEQTKLRHSERFSLPAAGETVGSLKWDTYGNNVMRVARIKKETVRDKVGKCRLEMISFWGIFLMHF